MLDAADALNQFPDLLAEFNAWDERIVIELQRMGYTASEARALIEVTLKNVNPCLMVQDNGPGFIRNSQQARAIVYATSWFLLTGGNPNQPGKLAPCNTGHWLERRTNDALEEDVLRRFDLEATPFRALMSVYHSVRFLCGIAIAWGGHAMECPPCCVSHAQNVTTMSLDQRRAGAAVLLAWVMFQEMGDSIGRQVAERQVAAEH